MTLLLLFLIALAIAIFALPYLLISKNTLPQPSGKWQVGTTDIDWDAPNSIYRGIIAKVWYPTEEQSGINSPYIDRLNQGIGSRLADDVAVDLVYKLIFWLLRRIAPTSAFVNATPLDIPGGSPVILFSPGSGGINYVHTFHALEFASHGFVVVGINHPESNTGTILTDGSQIKFAKIESLMDDVVKFQIHAGKIMQIQGKNMSAVLDKIIYLNALPESLLYQKIDPNRIFAAGHSIGGGASFIACGKDRRITKGIDIDGIFIDLDIDRSDYSDRQLLLIYSDREKYKPTAKKALAQYNTIVSSEKESIDRLSALTNLEKFVFESTPHMSFADLSIFLNPAIGKKLGLLGDVNGLRVLSETSAMTIDFFNK
jgi:hypothetical protein